jgi:hypothetical protein
LEVGWEITCQFGCNEEKSDIQRSKIPEGFRLRLESGLLEGLLVTGLLDGLLVTGFLEGLLDFIVLPEIYNRLHVTGFKAWFTKI